MGNPRAPFLLWILFFGSFCNFLSSEAVFQEERKAYIVYMGNKPKNKGSTSDHHHMRMLQEVPGSSIPPECLVHSYKRSFNGFVARLTKDEVQKIAGMAGVVSVFPNQKRHLHTTRSWDFMKFSQHVRRTAVESNIIVGVLDTGIWPESPSFKDYGFGPPPRKWKGSCRAANFTCNNKLVGAKFYRSDRQFPKDDSVSPRDVNGHGTHTASTVAGGLVNGASLYGLGQGIARGGVPSARIAVYKVCWTDGCYDADILHAFDDAIADGVDIISLSVGWFKPLTYFNDAIAIGAFHAMTKGIMTSNSAGNDGPGFKTIKNFSPWSLSVAASTIDRKFFTGVQLGNKNIYQGISKNTFNLNGKMFPLIYAGDAPNTTGGFTSSTSRYCYENSVDLRVVRGRIVLCDSFVSPVSTSHLINKATGIIMQDSGSKDTSYAFPLPASYLGPQAGQSIRLYINQTRNSFGSASATIFKTSPGNDRYAPYVASFSSRGPNPVTLDILKPDISAPGVDILAAWSPVTSLTGVEGDNRFVHFNIISGTSMSCPHVTAVASYVKSFHPTWSPAALKSALMTTADPMSPQVNSEAEFAYGSGHVNPVRAAHPGLVYDAGKTDYVRFLCGQGYNSTLLQRVTGDSSTCSPTNRGTVWELNYPSFALSTFTFQLPTRVFKRTVTNVGSPKSTYKSYVEAPLELKIKVYPPVLSFSRIGQKLSFAVTIKGVINRSIVSASLAWDDGFHRVRSPIVVFLKA